MEVNINDKLYKGILAYCQLNDLKCNEYINELLQKQFMIDRYGEKPMVSKHFEPEEVKTTIEKESNQKEEIKNEVETVIPIKSVVVDINEESETVQPTNINDEPLNEQISEPLNEPKKKTVKRRLYR